MRINEYNKSGFLNSTINRDHKNILEIEPLQTLITKLITHEATTTLPEFISSSTPPTADADKRLRIGVHSPVALHLYDSLGRHTGPIPNPDPASDLLLYEEQIPNSYYWQIGEGQYAGADAGTTTEIVLTGKDLGTFTLDVEEVTGDTTMNITVYEDIPVTASTTATVNVGSATTSLSLDIDGDGTTDTTITEDGLDDGNLIGILKGMVKTLNLPGKREQKLLKKIQKLEKELAKEHKNEKKEKRKTDKAFKELLKKISKFEKKKLLSAEEAGELRSVVERIRAGVVE